MNKFARIFGAVPQRLSYCAASVLLFILAGCTGGEIAEQQTGPERTSLEPIVSGTKEETKVSTETPTIVLDANEKILDKQEEYSQETSFSVIEMSPAPRSKYRALTSSIHLKFSKSLLNGEFDPVDFVLMSDDQIVKGELTFYEENNEIVFTPFELLKEKTEYEIVLSEEIMSVDGDTLGSVDWGFKTAPNVGHTPQEVIDNCMTQQDAIMLGAVNNLRGIERSCGDEVFLPTKPMVWSCRLAKVAQVHTDDMVRNDYFSHVDLNGNTVGGRATEQGYQWWNIAENIAAGQLNVQAVLVSWVEQPTHCKNIMSSTFTQMGGGFSESMGTRYRTYWSQTFARPMSNLAGNH